MRVVQFRSLERCLGNNFVIKVNTGRITALLSHVEAGVV